MKIFLASVVKPHGILGEVEINFADHDSLKVGMSLFTEDESVYIIDGIKKKTKSTVLKLQGINSIEEAERFRGTDLYAFISDLPPLDETSFYLAELIGLTVLDENSDVRGFIKDYYETKAHGVVVLEFDDGRRIDIPFVKRYIGDVDRENKKIVIFDLDSFL